MAVNSPVLQASSTAQYIAPSTVGPEKITAIFAPTLQILNFTDIIVSRDRRRFSTVATFGGSEAPSSPSGVGVGA